MLFISFVWGAKNMVYFPPPLLSQDKKRVAIVVTLFFVYYGLSMENPSHLLLEKEFMTQRK